MAADDKPGGDAHSEAHPPGKQSPPAPEPGLIDRVSNALDAAEKTLTERSQIDIQIENTLRSATEAITSHSDSGLPPWDGELEGGVGISASATPGAPGPHNPGFGTGETHPTPAPEAAFIDKVSSVVDLAGDAAEAAVAAPGRWMNPPSGPEGSVGISVSTSFGSPPATNPGFGAGETHPAPEPQLTGHENPFGPTSGIHGGVDVGGADGLGWAPGDLPATSGSIFDHVPDDVPSAGDPFDGIGTDALTSASLDPMPVHAMDPAPEPAPDPIPLPAPEPANAPPAFDPADQAPPC
jgi:hypothetical protein